VAAIRAGTARGPGKSTAARSNVGARVSPWDLLVDVRGSFLSGLLRNNKDMTVALILFASFFFFPI
jgi:hypothetical protein